ncbi:four-carbon acid sugar kinase family protein [Tessaracoccus defluvii]|uniref:Four-carbon acid sugar kinase N-terminal domain-containing protein n=1 Tax=Tessaracoccus defluvii TaxID=1285901 RepID=A0A7H0H533_9ACTN|nr:four-carbon acid sugar kinase family protein [Tessaracoccus defluvii]QNP55649.1 hypothetical protein H9L22_16045 [Tessaracoccus defluvii]
MTAAVGFYADDFTGATDVLLQLRRCGLVGPLVLRVDPDLIARYAGAAVLGVAGTARSLPTADMAAEVTPALGALAALRPRVLQYKACSTVDSSPRSGVSAGRRRPARICSDRGSSLRSSRSPISAATRSSAPTSLPRAAPSTGSTGIRR